MEVRAAVRGQDSALGGHGGRRDHQVVRSASGSAAVDVRQQSSVDVGRGKVVGLDRQRFKDFDEELGTGGALALGGKFDTCAQLGDRYGRDHKIVVFGNDFHESGASSPSLRWGDPTLGRD